MSRRQAVSGARAVEGALDPGELASLDGLAIKVVRRIGGPHPSPGLIAYALRRAQAELDVLGLTIVVQPRGRRNRPPRARPPQRPPIDADAQVALAPVDDSRWGMRSSASEAARQSWAPSHAGDEDRPASGHLAPDPTTGAP